MATRATMTHTAACGASASDRIPATTVEMAMVSVTSPKSKLNTRPRIASGV